MSEGGRQPVAGESPEAILGNLLRQMKFEDATVEVFDGTEEGEVLFHVNTAEAAQLIGRGAQVLEALQTVLNRMIRSDDETRTHYIIDVERYRERRKDKLLQMALEAEDRAAGTGRPVRLPVMGARDRRTIHRALVDHDEVRTESEEVEPGKKRVVVYPAEDR